MAVRFKKGALFLSLASIVFVMTSHNVVSAPPIPKPLLILTGVEVFEQEGKQLLRYRFDVSNKYLYPPPMFAAAPGLPPCGTNTNSSRTWVDIYDQAGNRLNGFCAFGKPGDLRQIWFALDADLLPPSWVYIELNDRQTNIRYRSNLAETVP